METTSPDPRDGDAPDPMQETPESESVPSDVSRYDGGELEAADALLALQGPQQPLPISLSSSMTNERDAFDPDEATLLGDDDGSELDATAQVLFAMMGTHGEQSSRTDTTDEQRPLRFHFLDVGQGSGTLIECPGGEFILVDLGSVSFGQHAEGWSNSSVPEMLRKKVKSYLTKLTDCIDYLVISHADQDHLNLVSDVLAGLTIKHVLCGGTLANYKNARKPARVFCKFLDGRGIDIADCLLNGGQPYSEPPGASKPRIQCTEGLEVRVVAANAPVRSASDIATIRAPHAPKTVGTPTNASSIVLSFRYGEQQVLICADATFSTDYFILEGCPAWTGQLKSYALSGGHHGSEGSYSETFLEAVDPAWVHFSADVSSYVHPRWALIDRIMTYCKRIGLPPLYGPHGVVVGAKHDLGEKARERLGDLGPTLAELEKTRQKLQKKFGSTARQIRWTHTLFCCITEILTSPDRQYTLEGTPVMDFPEEHWLQEVAHDVLRHWHQAPRISGALDDDAAAEYALDLADSCHGLAFEFWSDQLDKFAQETAMLETRKDDFAKSRFHWFTTQANIFTLLETANQGLYWILEIAADGTPSTWPQ